MTKRKLSNDQRSDVKNPNNEQYVLDLKNQIKLRQREIAKMQIVEHTKVEELKGVQRKLSKVLKKNQ
ncbi:MAG: hypothetical protein IJK62_02865 [Bacteroidales bacterium]|nr:hypothetical protein [Bacteroidales bacterium]